MTYQRDWTGRCSEGSCPVRFKTGGDRYCPMCQDSSSLSDAARELGINLSEVPQFAPLPDIGPSAH